MKRELRNSIALCILLGSTCTTCIAINAPPSGQDKGASNVLSVAAAADLFHSLDLTRPELASVAVAWKRNDKALAQRELARYFRTRTSVGWKPQTDGSSRISPHSQAVADAAVEGKLEGGMVPLAYAFPNRNIDWHFNATYHTPGQAHNDEWQWQLNRMSFWSDLAVAYRVTGDQRYAEAFVQELRSWIVQCPVPDHADNRGGSSWRTIEAGIRSGGSWMDAFYAFRGSAAMSDDDLLALVNSFLDHAKYLEKNHTRLNWLTMEMSGLYSIGAVFPEFRDAAEWRTYAATTMAEEGSKQFLPDGAQVELSSGYQNVALDNIFNITDIARWTGTSAELPSGYFAPFEKAFEWQVDIVAPDRWLPKINDSWPAYLPGILKKAVISYPSQSAFQWFASNERQGSPPPFTSVFLNRSGLAAMRSGWDTDANYLLFRVGPLGMGHQHQDSLGIDVWAYGRELIFNGGGGSYDNSKWRQWAISAFAHNTLVVDDMAQTRPVSQVDPFHDPNMVSQGPIDAHWKTNSVFDFASGVYAEGYGPSHNKIVSQQRDVLFLKPNIYVVADRVNPNDSLPHRFQARWQILTTHSRIDSSTQSLVTEDPGVPNISVVPLLVDHLRVESVSGQEEPEILGWDVRKDAVPSLVPATTLLQTVTGSGPHVILTMFVSLRAGEANPIKRVEPGVDGVSATVIFAGGRRLRISCPGSLGISAQEILPNGTVGRSIKGGTS
jgi:hypothetical protein